MEWWRYLTVLYIAEGTLCNTVITGAQKVIKLSLQHTVYTAAGSETYLAGIVLYKNSLLLKKKN